MLHSTDASMLAPLVGKVAYTMSTFGDRLELAIARSKKTRASLAKRLRSPDGTMGVSASAISQAIRGETKSFSAENCMRAAAFLNVSPFWLATGEGDMQPHPHELHVSEPSPVYMRPADVLDQMGSLLAEVPAPRRHAVAETMRGWASEAGEDHWKAMLLSLLSPVRVASTGQH